MSLINTRAGNPIYSFYHRVLNLVFWQLAGSC